MEHSVRNGVTITSRKRRARKTKGRKAKLREFQTPNLIESRIDVNDCSRMSGRAGIEASNKHRAARARSIVYIYASDELRPALSGQPPAPVRRRPAAVPASGLRHGGARRRICFFSRNSVRTLTPVSTTGTTRLMSCMVNLGFAYMGCFSRQPTRIDQRR
jgi:hypothetical protein